jgi:hypothetical protein
MGTTPAERAARLAELDRWAEDQACARNRAANPELLCGCSDLRHRGALPMTQGDAAPDDVDDLLFIVGTYNER